MDSIKCVPLARANWFLTVAGEARERYELVDDPAFGFGPSDTNGYLLQRFLFSTDWHAGARARVFVELQSGLTHGRNGLPVPSLSDNLDLHQGFVDLVPLKRARHELRIRAGRQELAFGTGRLVSAARGTAHVPFSPEVAEAHECADGCGRNGRQQSGVRRRR